MALKSHTQWKEELIITDEQGNSFCFGCGWGVEPPVAYIPSQVDWSRCVPGWLTDRPSLGGDRSDQARGPSG